MTAPRIQPPKNIEPLSRAARTGTLSAAIGSRAMTVLTGELRRYCNGEIKGRSFLISGHRGAGKTTLVAHALNQVIEDARLGDVNLRPLYVQLHGPSLFPEGEVAASATLSAAEETAAEAPMCALFAMGERSRSRDKGKANDGGGSGDARVALEQVTLALHRAAAREFIDRLWTDKVARSISGPSQLRELTSNVLRDLASVISSPYAAADATSRRQGVANWLRGAAEAAGSPPPIPVPTAKARHPQLDAMVELVASFEHEIYESPGPIRLREFWRRLKILDCGILSPPEIMFNRSAAPRAQGFRELIALAGVCEAHRRISGVFQKSDSDADEALQRLKAQLDVSGSGNTLISPLTSLVAGGAVGGLVASHTDPTTATVAGVVAALTSTLVFKWSRSTESSRVMKREYHFLFDTSIATLDRVLPVLIDRLINAGLAPVFIVDELDKIDSADRIFGMVRHLKKLVAETAFFCFLTDRSYFEDMRGRAAGQAYPLEYSFFSHRLFVTYTASDLHRYLGGRLGEIAVTRVTDPATSGLPPIVLVPPDQRVEFALLRYLLLHRSEMHPLELQRLLANRDANPRMYDDLRLRGSYRIEIAQQVAMEIVLDDPEIVGRIQDEPEFQRLVYDALFYPSRRRREGEAEIDFDRGKPDFESYLQRRMESTERRTRQGTSADEAAANTERRTRHRLGDADVDVLWALVEMHVALLGDGQRFATRFDEWNGKRADHEKVDRAVIELLELHDDTALPMRHVEERRYRWRHAPQKAAGAAPLPDEERSSGSDLEANIALIRAFAALLQSEIVTSSAAATHDRLDFAALTDRHRILPTSRSWTAVQASMARLAESTVADRSSVALADDIGNVDAFARTLKLYGRLIAKALVCRAMLDRLIPPDSSGRSAPLPDALTGFAAAYRFAALSADDVEARFDRAWRDLERWVPLGEVSWPSVAGDTFADYSARLNATLTQVAAIDPQLSLVEAQTEAWSSVATRYIGSLSGREPDAAIEELVCWRFGASPSQIPFSIGATPAFVWSRLLLGPGRDPTAPPEMRLIAAHALGFSTTSYERAAAFAGDAAAPFLDGHPELFGQPRERRLLVLCKNEGSLAASWTPPPTIAVLPLTHQQASPMREDALLPEALSVGTYAVLAVEYSADVARNSAFVETVRAAATRGTVGVPMPVVFFGQVDPALVDFKPYIHLPRRYEDLFPAMHATPVA